jgi:hypothetical protein
VQTGTAPDPSKAIEKMQQNFLNMGMTGPLAVACINEHDHTRPSLAWQHNDLIDCQFCRAFLNQLRRVELWAWVKEVDGEVLAKALDAISNGGKNAASASVVQAIAQVLGSAQCDFQQFDLEAAPCPPKKSSPSVSAAKTKHPMPAPAYKVSIR